MCFSSSHKRAFRGGGAAPSKAGTRKRPYSQFNIIDFPKKGGKWLDFPATGCKLCFGKRVSPLRNPPSVLILSVISAKDDVNPPSFKICSFVPEWKYQQGPLCLRVLLGVSLLFRERGLGGTYIIVHGDSSGFFVFSRPLSARKHVFFPKNAAEPARYDKRCRTPCAIVYIESIIF